MIVHDRAENRISYKTTDMKKYVVLVLLGVVLFIGIAALTYGGCALYVSTLPAPV